MGENKPRFLPDGTKAVDVTENPKRAERVAREAAEKLEREQELRSPWSRERVELHLARALGEGVLGFVNGQEIRTDADFHGADLSGLDLSGLDFSRANMHGTNLVGAKLSGCRLVGANLHEAELRGAAMDNVNAVEANFHGACLCGANVGKTHFMKANLCESCCEATEGLGIVEKPLTPAEASAAKYKQAEGFRVDISYGDKGGARVLYVGSTLENANISGMTSECKRRKK